jgi:hypothetical protein
MDASSMNEWYLEDSLQNEHDGEVLGEVSQQSSRK